MDLDFLWGLRTEPRPAGGTPVGTSPTNEQPAITDAALDGTTRPAVSYREGAGVKSVGLNTENATQTADDKLAAREAAIAKVNAALAQMGGESVLPTDHEEQGVKFESSNTLPPTPELTLMQPSPLENPVLPVMHDTLAPATPPVTEMAPQPVALTEAPPQELEPEQPIQEYGTATNMPEPVSQPQMTVPNEPVQDLSGLDMFGASQNTMPVVEDPTPMIPLSDTPDIQPVQTISAEMPFKDDSKQEELPEPNKENRFKASVAAQGIIDIVLEKTEVQLEKKQSEKEMLDNQIQNRQERFNRESEALKLAFDEDMHDLTKKEADIDSDIAILGQRRAVLKSKDESVMQVAEAFVATQVAQKQENMPINVQPEQKDDSAVESQQNEVREPNVGDYSAKTDQQTEEPKEEQRGSNVTDLPTSFNPAASKVAA